MNAATLSVDTVECELFVRLWLELTGAGHITLTAIPAAGGATTTATFAPIRFEAMTRWLEIHQAVNKNVYFQVNETHPRCARKPAKGDIIAALTHPLISPRESCAKRLQLTTASSNACISGIEPVLRHVRDQFVEHAALAEQRMRVAFRAGVGLEAVDPSPGSRPPLPSMVSSASRTR